PVVVAAVPRQPAAEVAAPPRALGARQLFDQAAPRRALHDVDVIEDPRVVTHNGMLEHAVDMTETGMMVGAAAWTNTATNGTALGADHCENWSVGMFGPKG